MNLLNLTTSAPTTNHLAPRASVAPVSRPLLVAARDWPRELLAREPRLAIYGALLLVLLAPLALAWGVDDRVLRGANVWLKPMKFAGAIALLALTTAWFVGHLPVLQRSARSIDRIVWLLIGAGSFELAYIVFQAGLGEASHYNVGDAWHAAMYSLMGLGAVTLTATQPMLAWQLYRHPDPSLPVAYRQAVLIGLVLTFVLGAGVGGVLSARQPPDGGATLPFFGWALKGGDLRPAHFLGIHAEQVLPLFGFAVASLHLKGPQRWVGLATAFYVAVFAFLVTWGLSASDHPVDPAGLADLERRAQYRHPGTDHRHPRQRGHPAPASPGDSARGPGHRGCEPASAASATEATLATSESARDVNTIGTFAPSTSPAHSAPPM